MAITTSGTSITFNDATVQTTAFTGGGGVTSLNGQTGAITNTSVDAIGSVIFAAVNTTTGLKPGDTIAGSSLYYPNTVINSGAGNAFYNSQSGSSPNTVWFTGGSGFYVRRQNSGNTGWQVPTGSSTLSGTWRIMGQAILRFSTFDSCSSVTSSVLFQTLVVRVS